MARAVPMTFSVTEVREVADLIEAVNALPVRWSDQCGECAWCRLDLAMANLRYVAQHSSPSDDQGGGA